MEELKGREKKCFICVVKNRSSNVLVDLVHRYIMPGSIIISDQRKGYSKLSEHGYNHYSVNHSKNWVDPEKKWVHTQNIERLWGSLKSIVPKKTNCQQLETYCFEFMFRRNYLVKENAGQNFKIIPENIGDLFPCF